MTSQPTNSSLRSEQRSRRVGPVIIAEPECRCEYCDSTHNIHLGLGGALLCEKQSCAEDNETDFYARGCCSLDYYNQHSA